MVTMPRVRTTEVTAMANRMAATVMLAQHLLRLRQWPQLVLTAKKVRSDAGFFVEARTAHSHQRSSGRATFSFSRLKRTGPRLGNRKLRRAFRPHGRTVTSTCRDFASNRLGFPGRDGQYRRPSRDS